MPDKREDKKKPGRDYRPRRPWASVQITISVALDNWAFVSAGLAFGIAIGAYGTQVNAPLRAHPPPGVSQRGAQPGIASSARRCPPGRGGAPHGGSANELTLEQRGQRPRVSLTMNIM